MSWAMRMRVGAAWVGIAAFVLVTFGSSLVGLGILLTGEYWGDGGVTEDELIVTRYAFGMAILVQLVVVMIWWETRRRQPGMLAVGAVSALASAAAYLATIAAPGIPDDPWLPPLTIAAAVGGVVIVVLASAVKSEGRDSSKKPPRRGPRSFDKQQRYKDARTRVLRVLLERRLVALDEAEQKRILEMPLGYWEELDGVDEVEWRRILELRHHGWRDFDETDRRPWPPTER